MGTEKTTIVSEPGTKVQVQCQRCAGTTKHVVLCNVNASGEDNQYYWDNDYQIVQCGGCETLSFRSAKTNSESVDHYDDENGNWQTEYIVDEKIYPPRNSDFIGLTNIWLLPTKLRNVYQETVSALHANQPILAAIGIRAILDTLCRDKKAKGKDLFLKIDFLVSQRVLTPQRAEILHKIRNLGNNAAHEGAPHSSAQLGLALKVIDNLLEEIYILPQRAAMDFPVKVSTSGKQLPIAALSLPAEPNNAKS